MLAPPSQIIGGGAGPPLPTPMNNTLFSGRKQYIWIVTGTICVATMTVCWIKDSFSFRIDLQITGGKSADFENFTQIILCHILSISVIVDGYRNLNRNLMFQ